MTKGERVIVISEMIREYVLKNYPKTDPAKLRLIYRGVDPTEFPYGYKPAQAWLDEWYRQYPQTQGKKLLTLPARITRWKGQEDFVELMAQTKDFAPDAHGLIVGETKKGKEGFLGELKAKAEELGIADRLTFIGHRSDLREIMAISSIVLSLAREPEAFGRTTIEALSLGRPVVGYNHGGVGEQLESVYPIGKVNPHVSEELVLRVRTLLDSEQDLPKRNHIFTLENMLSKTLAIYEELSRKESESV
ncbi:MAG: glycosyltransferase [Rubrivivax sp.]|nr:glycosyltransferase [Rubrivivax sp.]